MHPLRQETGKFITAILTGIIRNKNYYYKRVNGPAVITEFAARNKCPQNKHISDISLNHSHEFYSQNENHKNQRCHVGEAVQF
jgi:hypothetical protein